MNERERDRDSCIHRPDACDCWKDTFVRLVRLRTRVLHIIHPCGYFGEHWK